MHEREQEHQEARLGKQEQTSATEHERHSSRERPTNLSPKIYVASLSDYNAGRLHGEWIDADQTEDEIFSEINAMLARSREPGAEEFAIHDFDNFGAVRIQEYESIERVVRIARGLTEHGAAFGYWANRCLNETPSDEFESELDRFGEAFLGQWESEGAFAESVLDDHGIEAMLDAAVPAGLRPYVTVDVASFARDLSTDLWTAQDSAGIWAFWA